MKKYDFLNECRSQTDIKGDIAASHLNTSSVRVISLFSVVGPITLGGLEVDSKHALRLQSKRLIAHDSRARFWFTSWFSSAGLVPRGPCAPRTPCSRRRTGGCLRASAPRSEERRVGKE